MEEERQKDLRVPLIFGMFLVSCLTGGILLILWYLDVTGSQPWFQIMALVLIGLPWIFWFLTYIYTFIKSCFRRSRIAASSGGGGDSRRSSNHAKPAATSAVNETSPRDSPVNSPVGKRQVQFGAVVVMEDHHLNDAGESSVASSKECEMPLNLSVLS